MAANSSAIKILPVERGGWGVLDSTCRSTALSFLLFECAGICSVSSATFLLILTTLVSSQWGSPWAGLLACPGKISKEIVMLFVRIILFSPKSFML